MREILFRGKIDDRDRSWIEGYLFKSKYLISGKSFVGILSVDSIMYPHSEIDDYEEVIPETVGQFTGLVDANGKKIFEGDIVEGQAVIIPDNPHPLMNWKVVFQDGEFLFHNGIVTMSMSNLQSIKIIGNIHDNPELWEEKSS